MPGSQCCEHCAEIPELRKQIAELRARLDGLSGAPEYAESSRPAQAKIEKPYAFQQPQQMALLRPVHGAPLPQVDQESGIQDKLDLYRTLFAGRSDVYAYRRETPRMARRAGRRDGGRAPPATTRITCRSPTMSLRPISRRTTPSPADSM